MMPKYMARMTVCACLLVLAAPCGTALAATPWDYRPVVIDGGFRDARTAYKIAEPEKGHIGYHHARDAAPALWFRFEGVQGDRITLQMGVPALDRYRLLRPAVAVLAPGLPPVGELVPFEIPTGYGGVVYHTAALDIELYEDTHLGTASWRFESVEYILPVGGPVFVVGFIPIPADAGAEAAALDGKFWMSMGHKVNFRMGDIIRMYPRAARIRRFYEDAVIQSNLYRNGIMGLVISLIAMMIAVA